jgi:hypothetical protein
LKVEDVGYTVDLDAARMPMARVVFGDREAARNWQRQHIANSDPDDGGGMFW